MAIKHFFFDLETTGLDPKLSGIHQISARLFVDYLKEFEFNVHVRPFPNDQIDPKALEIAGKTIENLKQSDHYSPYKVYKRIIEILSQFCNKFDKTDKIFLCGYNNATFDNPFFRSFFEKNGDKYFDSWFFSGAIDVMTLAAQQLTPVRHLMPNFKLATVAEQLGFAVEEDSLHDAFYDLVLTTNIFEKVTGIQFQDKKID